MKCFITNTRLSVGQRLGRCNSGITTICRHSKLTWSEWIDYITLISSTIAETDGLKWSVECSAKRNLFTSNCSQGAGFIAKEGAICLSAETPTYSWNTFWGLRVRRILSTRPWRMTVSKWRRRNCPNLNRFPKILVNILSGKIYQEAKKQAKFFKQISYNKKW